MKAGHVALGFATTTLSDPLLYISLSPSVPLNLLSPSAPWETPMALPPTVSWRATSRPDRPYTSALPWKQAPTGPPDCSTQAHHRLGYKPLHMPPVPLSWTILLGPLSTSCQTHLPSAKPICFLGSSQSHISWLPPDPLPLIHLSPPHRVLAALLL